MHTRPISDLTVRPCYHYESTTTTKSPSCKPSRTHMLHASPFPFPCLITNCFYLVSSRRVSSSHLRVCCSRSPYSLLLFKLSRIRLVGLVVSSSRQPRLPHLVSSHLFHLISYGLSLLLSLPFLVRLFRSCRYVSYVGHVCWTW